MRFGNVSISSVTHVDATHRLSSAELEARLEPTMRRLGIPKGLLEGLSGIVARRVWDPGVQPSDAATLAAERAIGLAGIDRQRLGVLISTSVCRDFIEPSTACLVHGKLGLDSHCINFDLGNACLGFLSGMDVVANMIERGQVDYGIVVDGETSSFVVDSTVARLQGPEVDMPAFWANFATLTLGSGAAAMVLARSELAPAGHRFLGGVTVAATEHRDLCRGQVDHMVTSSAELLTAGLELALQTWRVAERELGWTRAGLAEFVIHQVSKTHVAKLGATLDLDPAKILTTYAEYGNVGPAGIPMVLAKAAELGRLQRGDRVALMGIGSGLNCSMAELVW